MRKIVILLFLALATAVVAQDSVAVGMKSGMKQANSLDGITRGAGSTQSTGNNGYTVPEPEAIGLLGAGLVSLGIYAKRKQGKKA